MIIKHFIVAFAVFATAGSAFSQQTEWIEPTARFVSSSNYAKTVTKVQNAQPKATNVIENASISNLLKQIIH